MLATPDVGAQLVADKQYLIFAQRAQGKIKELGCRLSKSRIHRGYHPRKEPSDASPLKPLAKVRLGSVCVFAQTASGNERKGNTVIAESSFASFRQIAYVRVGQFFHTGAWLGRVALRPAVELAFLYGRATRGINLADASPERSVVGSRVPILLIHGLADDNIPHGQSEWIRAHNPAEIVLWEVPLAGHCGSVNAAPQEFDTRVLGWFTSHDRGYSAAPPLT